MRKRALEECEYLWTDQRDEWALLKDDKDPSNLSKYLIFNIKTQSALVIEDDDLAMAVINKMVENNVRVISGKEFIRDHGTHNPLFDDE